LKENCCGHQAAVHATEQTGKETIFADEREKERGVAEGGGKGGETRDD